MGPRKAPLLSKILRPISTLYTESSDYDATRSRKLNHEQQICVFNGREKFRMVSPIFRKNIYVGEFEALQQDESPVDFFNPDYTRFPFTKHVTFIETILSNGDCMYVPAYYYVQSRTLGEKVKMP